MTFGCDPVNSTASSHHYSLFLRIEHRKRAAYQVNPGDEEEK
jgi:hypothetical protein